MLHTSLKLIQRMPLCVILLALSFTGRAATAAEPYRMLSPTGAAPHPAGPLVPGCSGFTVTNGVDQYNERAAELQAAGYAVVFVDYVGRRMQNNCAHVSLAEVSSDILEAATLARDQSDVDMTRISVIGWSYGGGGILAALKAMPPGSPVFTKAVMYYPVCRGARSGPLRSLD